MGIACGLNDGEPAGRVVRFQRASASSFRRGYAPTKAIDGVLCDDAYSGWSPRAEHSGPGHVVLETRPLAVSADDELVFQLLHLQTGAASHELLGRFRISLTNAPNDGSMPVSWEALDASDISVPEGLFASVLSDGSILVSGTAPATGGYALVAKTSLDEITAVRLEALPDPSLPDGGPGLVGGSFVVSEAVLLVRPSDSEAYLGATTFGSGAGVIRSEPAGLLCPPDCMAAFDAGTPITLTAVPAEGSVFAGWGAACAGTDVCTIFAQGRQWVTAVFNKDAFPFGVTTLGSGAGVIRSNPTGIECPPDCGADFDRGASIAFIAEPAPGSIFAGWGDACEGTGDCILTADQARWLTATFNHDAFPFGATTFGSGTGVIRSNPVGIICPPACGADFPRDAAITFTAEPAPGSIFAGWGDACDGTGNCTVTADQPRWVTVTFNRDGFHVGATTFGGLGLIRSDPPGIACPPDCGATFVRGTQITFTAEPGPDSALERWGEACSGADPCVVDLQGPVWVTATFGPVSAL